jgi:hypothetical protein
MKMKYLRQCCCSYRCSRCQLRLRREPQKQRSAARRRGRGPLCEIGNCGDWNRHHKAALVLSARDARLIAMRFCRSAVPCGCATFGGARESP